MTQPGEAMLRERFRVVVPVQVRFRDLDAMGHVNNAVYLTYLEMGRLAYYRELMGLTHPKDFNFILAHVSIDFRSPVVLGETVYVGLSVTRVGRRSFEFTYELREGASGRLVAEATSVQVMYDYQRQTPIPVPDEFRRRLEAFEGRPFPVEARGTESARGGR